MQYKHRKETHATAKGCSNMDAGAITKQDTNSQNSQNTTNKSIDYFYSLSNIDEDKTNSSVMMHKIHEKFSNVFNGIGCFKGTILLQLKPDSKPYQVPPRHVAYALQKLFKEELECLQIMDIITLLGVDETAEWCNSFVLVPKANGKVRLCLDPVQLNQVLTRLIHQGPTLNYILPRLNNVQYMSITDVSSGYHNLRLDIQSSYLTTFASPFGRYWYRCLPFGAALVGTMFQCKVNEIYNDMPNVFGIADDILMIGYGKDRRDHDEAVYSVLKQCQDMNLKLNKDKCHFRCMSIPFFGEVVSWEGVKPDPQKIIPLTEMLVPKNKRELQSFLGIINYLSKFSPGTAEVCKPLRKLTSSKTTLTWDASYQQLFDKAKSFIKTKVCMKF